MAALSGSLLLDETTEGLAAVVRHEIRAGLAPVNRDALAILVIGKLFADLIPITDRVVVSERGRDVRTGESRDPWGGRGAIHSGVHSHSANRRPLGRMRPARQRVARARPAAGTTCPNLRSRLAYRDTESARCSGVKSGQATGGKSYSE